MRAILEQLLSGRPVSAEDMDQLFEAMLSGSLSDTQTAAILAALRLRGEGAAELAAGAQCLRRNAAPVSLPAHVRPLTDNCGTGGDGANTFNISTAAAIVASGCGPRMAKHGNRSVSSACGSADLLFEAGFPQELAPTAAAKLLEDMNLTFFYAPNYHPLMKHVGPVRKALGVRTVFNLLGPLANPLGPEHQLIGVGDAAYLRPMAEALATLGIHRAIVVHSRDGLDEVSPEVPTDAVIVENGACRPAVIDPESLGQKARTSDLGGGGPERNVEILGGILQGEKSACRDAVALNAAAVLWAAGVVDSMGDGLAKVNDYIDSQKARAHFRDWIAHAQTLAQNDTADTESP